MKEWNTPMPFSWPHASAWRNVMLNTVLYVSVLRSNTWKVSMDSSNVSDTSRRTKSLQTDLRSSLAFIEKNANASIENGINDQGESIELVRRSGKDRFSFSSSNWESTDNPSQSISRRTIRVEIEDSKSYACPRRCSLLARSATVQERQNDHRSWYSRRSRSIHRSLLRPCTRLSVL